jgi:hypothetical protein
MILTENKNRIHFKQRLLPNCLPHELEIVTVKGGESTNQYHKELAVVKFTGKWKKIKSGCFIPTPRTFKSIYYASYICVIKYGVILGG